MMASVEESPKERGQCETERIASEALMTLHTEATLSQMCELLKVSDVVQRNARGLWKALQKNPDLNTEEGSNAWFSCCLYIIATDASLPYGASDPQAIRGQLDGPGFTVTDLLKSCNVKITIFFEKMREIRDKHDLTKTVQQQLVKLEKRYCIVCAIFHKFEKLFKEVFREEAHIDVHEDPNVLKALNPEDYDFNKRLCWTLFLLAKGAYLGENQELVLAFDFLVCCVDFVMRYTPAFQLLPPFDSLRLSSNTHSLEETFLRRLCEHCNTSFDRVNNVKKTYTDPFIHSLKNERGLLEIDHLLELYSGVYYHQKDIDEMLFLEHDVHILPMISQTQRSPNPKVNSKVPMTPVRSALITVQQFQKILSSGSEGPSDKLNVFFENCSQRPDKAVSDRVSQLQEDFISSLVSVSSEKHRSIAEQRFKMAVRLYYRVMEALLSSEQERLSQKDFSTLLNQDVFHRSLLACAAEVVMTIYSVTWNTSDQAMNAEESDFAFPWILKTFSLKAYDFYKVLESFIRAEASLTKDIIRHLQGVENRILESIAWEQDSPLFDALASCEISHIPPPSPSNNNNNNAPFASAAQLYLSPACGRQVPSTPPAQVAEGTGLSAPSPHKHNRSPSQGTQPKTPPPPRRSQSLNLFFNKVCRLGHHRLQALCNFLDVPKDLQQKIWTCFEFCIIHKPELLKNRHLDQIMMCSIYAMCKVQEKEIKFKTIVNMYKNLPNASQAVYKEAVISEGVHDTIIVFYNKVFMFALKSYILQFSGNRSNAPPLSPVPKAVASPLMASPTYSLPGRENFTVSSLRASPFKTPMSPSQMTPRTRALYSFGDLQGSAEKLQMINERMSAVKRLSDQTVIRSNKRLRFDQCDEPPPSSNSGEQTVIVIKRTPGGAVKALTPLSPSKGANADNLQPSSGNTGLVNRSEQGGSGES